MSRLLITLSCLFFVTLTSGGTVDAALTRQVRLQKIEPDAVSNRTDIRIRPAADTTLSQCVVPRDTAVWRIDGWVAGSELFKRYLDPSAACEDPYPFVVTEITMPVYVAESTVLIVSVDVEAAYYASDDCPWPDSILAISSDYMVPIPAKGYYDIWVPLDEPLTVNGPFFAGFFIGNTVDSSLGVAVLTDDNRTAACQCYDIWDEQIGFVDLVSNGVLNFPGQLLLYASGIPGGLTKQAEPPPRISILSPRNNETLYGSTTIWAHEFSGSSIIDYVAFEYASDGQFIECGRDYDGSAPVRDGSDASGWGNGFCNQWDFSILAEGIYTLRVTAFDTLGRAASDTVTVYLEPSPPTPKIVSPTDGSPFCRNTDILVSCPDENLTRVEFYTRVAEDNYSAGVEPLMRSDSNPSSGASAAAAMALHLWSTRGVEFSLYDGQSQPSAARLARDLSALFEGGPAGGNSDEEMYCGLQLFNSVNNSALAITTNTSFDYSALRTLVQEQQQAVLLGLTGNGRIWIAVDGFEGWRQSDGTYRIVACHPDMSSKQTYSIRWSRSGTEIRVSDTWQPVDRLIAIGPVEWNIDRKLLGIDADGNDGWSFTWEPSGLTDGARCFVRVECADEDGFTAQQTILLDHDCSRSFTVGDYDGNESADIVDLAYLIEYVIRSGPEPVGGGWRADANGDRHLNVTDVIYYMNYLYGMADKPCH